MDTSKILGLLPPTLRDELFEAFTKIVNNYREARWEPSELNGGKLCEIVFSILAGYTAGSFPEKAYKPANMFDSCQNLAKTSSSFPRSVRIQIPRMIISLYEIRNNRGVGHVGGEVDPNHMDATIVLFMAKWLMAELIRIFHKLDTEEATRIVESIIDKEVPIIWRVNNKIRVLKKNMSMKEMTLVILYSEKDKVNEADLLEWTEHSNAAVFRRDILVPGHKSRLWEYDKSAGEVILSPLGIEYVESKLL